MGSNRGPGIYSTVSQYCLTRSVTLIPCLLGTYLHKRSKSAIKITIAEVIQKTNINASYSGAHCTRMHERSLDTAYKVLLSILYLYILFNKITKTVGVLDLNGY